jgi:hypothetical protein
VDVVADLPADAQAAKPAQQSDRALRDPAVDAEAGAVFGAAPGNVPNDLHGPDPVAMGLVVVAAVGIQRVPDDVYAGQAAKDDAQANFECRWFAV